MPGRIERRRFLQGAAALGLTPIAAQLLAACGDPGEDRLTFWNWQDYIAPGIPTAFEKETGIRIRYSTYASNDELEDRLTLAGVARKGGRKATTVDLIVPSDNLFRQLAADDRLQPLDPKIVTPALLDNLTPALREAQPDPGDRSSVPWATGTTGIGYDATVFDEPPGWDVFLDDAYAGKMTMLDEMREAYAAALFSLGEDPNTKDPAVIDAATRQLEKMGAVISSFDSATYLDRLRDGKIVAAQGFNTDVLQAKEDNPDLEFVIPDAGGTRWTDLLCIPADAPNPEAANQFIAFYLDPEISAENAEANQVDTGNEAARSQVPSSLLENPAVYPPADVQELLVTLTSVGAAASRYADGWEQVTG